MFRFKLKAVLGNAALMSSMMSAVATLQRPLHAYVNEKSCGALDGNAIVLAICAVTAFAYIYMIVSLTGKVWHAIQKMCRRGSDEDQEDVLLPKCFYSLSYEHALHATPKCKRIPSTPAMGRALKKQFLCSQCIENSILKIDSKDD